MKTLVIRWQRLVDEAEQTCDRCGATGTAVEQAFAMLMRGLKELGVEVVLQAERLDPGTFAQAPLESNRIWIGGMPIEWLLSASSGQSQCCSTCGDAQCRTVTIDGRTYEAIPVELIVKAGLLAAARLFQPDPPESRRGTSGGAAPPPDSMLPGIPCGCG